MDKMLFIMCLKTIITFILFISTLAAFSQTTVRGTIKSSGNQTPIPTANIHLIGETDSSSRLLTLTDTLGRFNFETTAKSKIILSITAIGYENYTLFVELGNPLVELGVLYLRPSTTLLSEVVVKANIPSVTINKSGNTLIRVADNKELTATANFLDVLKRIPGLVVNGENTILMGNGIQPEVFINGRPLHLNGTELISYLQGLPPERVLSVELIANPSAKYDGEFKAIIDIKLKKEKSAGWVASYTGQVDQNEFTSTYQNVNLSFNRNKLQAFGSFNYEGGKTIYRYAAFQHLPNTNFMATRLQQANGQNNYNLQTGIEYAINEKNKLSALVRYYSPLNEREREGSILMFDNDRKDTVSHFLNSNPLHYEQKNLALTLNHELSFKDFKLGFLINRLSVKNNQYDDFFNLDALAAKRLDYWKSDLRNQYIINSLQTDLSRKFNNWEIEGGFKIVQSNSANQLQFDVWDKDSGKFFDDVSRSNFFEYTERIKAGYLGFSGKIDKLTLSGGLRTEYTHTVSNSITLDSVVLNSYFKWLPSVSASYRIDDNQNIALSFSSRLTRPNFGQLNPFRSYFSIFNYWIGNPYLLPAKRDQFKINYQFKQLLIEANFGIERDVLARYPLYDAVTNEMAYLGTNLPQKKFANIVLNLPVKIKSWWQMGYQLSGYYNKEKTPYLNEVFNLNIYNYIARLNQVFSLPGNTALNLVANYESRSGNSLYIIKPMYNVDISVQKKWLQGKLNTKLAFLDLFNTYSQYLIFRRKDMLNNELSHWWGMRKAQFSITYNFGSETTKMQNPRVSEEDTRVR